MGLIILGFVILLVAMFIAAMIYLNESYVSSESTLFVMFTTLVSIIIILVSAKDIMLEHEYKTYRDKSYTDNSKDKNYQKWLIDNPKGKEINENN